MGANGPCGRCSIAGDAEPETRQCLTAHGAVSATVVEPGRRGTSRNGRTNQNGDAGAERKKEKCENGPVTTETAGNQNEPKIWKRNRSIGAAQRFLAQPAVAKGTMVETSGVR